MTEEQLNKIFQQVFETENGKIILEIDPDIIKNPVLVKREREQRQAQSQEQQQLEQEAQAVDTASKAKQSQLI